MSPQTAGRRDAQTWLSFPTFKRYLVTGLVFLVPVFLTVYFLVALFNFVERTVGRRIDEALPTDIPGAGILFSLAIVLIIGFLGSTVLGQRLFNWGERMFLSLPVVRVVYQPTRQVVDFILNPKDTSLRKVVAVPYGASGAWCLGFLTGHTPAAIRDQCGDDLVNVFVPFTPTPATGLTLLVPREDVREVKMPVDDALKLIFSGGVLTPDGEDAPASVTAAKEGARRHGD